MGATGPAGPTGPGAGTFTIGIPAITCTAQGGLTSGDTGNCGGGGTVRSNGDANFPCIVRPPAGGTRATYVCELDLPSGALIDEITAYGLDNTATGYMEAAVWRTSHGSFGSQYISPSFAGNWQSSGLAATPFAFNFPIYTAADAPHVVDGGYRYTIGMGIESTGGTMYAYGFSVTYTIQ